ncbi:MAG: Coenzyme F420 hydrogenase/dehydrogenase, beta subunit C-terminal domain [Bacteroides sp.]|nr:Coenzyme F420 hydrogenase/dehydrogenase, beta subunit C-terminal domain [Bacteroides sp.]MCM1447164.1 Coenzyme F420 hydrogenase/dehydrogenase, beta subunit C-terminal domain [Bacteroides sp.]
MNNISDIKNCYGCGVCAASCGKKIIAIELNHDGFYEPRITDENQCTHCGICVDVCAFSHTELANADATPIKSWAAWSNDESIRRKCSSGGIGFQIGKQLIEQGYKAVGCRYDVNHQRAEHYIATTVEEFIASIGSKYIQSYTVYAFRQIERKGQKYIVTGTPCQIDSFRIMIRKFRCEDNFILLDFFCHCVPSMHAWKAYIKMLEPKIGNVTYASWINKPTGWQDSWTMQMNGSKGSVTSWRSKGDLFYKLFLGDVALGPQCEEQCKYKYDHSSADIRIGDLWGDTYKNDQKGVSALIAFTEKGRELVEGLKDVTLIEHPFEVVAEGQMKKNAQHAKDYRYVMSHLRKPNANLKFIEFGLKIRTMYRQVLRIIENPTKIKKILHI